MARNITAILILCCISLTANIARAATANDARQFVDNLGKQVLQVVNGGGSEAEKHKRLQQMFVDNVDIPWMAKFVLGAGGRQASDAQRQRYMQVYRQYLLARYTTNFADYTGSKYTITGATADENGQFTVDMQIKSPSQQQDTLAGYRLRADESGKFKITDIIIEGVSLITTQRSDFASVLQGKGMDGLIGALEAKAKTESSGGPD